jgi:DNA-binding CsgD family transcriptional regulator
MKDITICTRTHYLHISISELIKKIKPAEPSPENSTVFVFEGTWLTPLEFLNLKCCPSGRILVIASEATVRFLIASLSSEKISYAYIDEDVNRLTTVLKSFVRSRYYITSPHPMRSKKSLVLTYTEYRIMQLYISGASIAHIARVTELSIKRVYNIKTYAMKRMGLFSDAALINYWEIITRWVQAAPPSQPPKSTARPPAKNPGYGYMVL